ncbi:hypothetical protein CV102_01230 [Natronococcus pandeyae]|uniref:histidine kinase n=1 Tax=Natronococcus pandeyae TaxID=2055836 RepID=A0A8J8Q6X7_9EURY|nr:PAS domain-containing sensor histidine kinase [Natronococcus pandeyae]TYL40232.1 hypothetical protein CV102_01230 [Natronococcus pandeyae]
MSNRAESSEMAFWEDAVEDEAHQRYRTLLNTIGDGIFQLDVEGRLVAVNDVMVEITGYDYDELLGTHVTEILNDKGSAVESEIDRLHENPSEQSALLEFPVQTADGKRILCEVRVNPFEADDSLQGSVGTVREILGRKRTTFDEREQNRESAAGQFELTDGLRQSEERLRLALEAGELGTWELDLQTEDSPVRSPQHDRIFGYEERVEDWSFDIFLDHVHPDDREFVARRFEEAFETGVWEFECRIIRADGEQRWIDAQGEFYYNIEGEPVRAIGMVQDITEQNEREEQLEEAIDKLEKSNERLERFAYATSHDLQEPLRMVSSYLMLIERRYDDELDDEVLEYIDFAINGAERMRDMIQALLTYSRIDTGERTLEPVDLDAVLADVRTDLQLKIEEHNAEVSADSLPRVEGDEEQLRQVFQNLLDNAIEYTRTDEPTVHISAERDGPAWKLTVCDEGVGIEPDDADRIFQVFERLHTNDEHGGTGIGLALCERVVEHHGGEIWVDSEPGEGSSFSFTLPAVDDHPP